MTRHTIAAAAMALAAVAFGTANAQAPAPKVKDACQADFQRLCPGVAPGHGAIRQCLKGHLDTVSPDCRSAVAAAREAATARRAARAQSGPAPATTPPQT